jgi:hypothetical protein
MKLLLALTPSWNRNGPHVIPTRYIIASLFIAALLLLAAIVQAPRSPKSGGVAKPDSLTPLSMESFEVVAEFRLEEGWVPRFLDTRDPDQPDPWPFEGGFGAPWEPASPYLGDQGFALNGPKGRSEVALWRGLEWRHYRFDSPLVSARVHPRRPNRLLVTLHPGVDRFETRLLEIPEGRVLWSADSGPWSRFSWDGSAVLLGLEDPQKPDRLLLTVLAAEADPGPTSLAPWDEKRLAPPPKGWSLRPEQLWDDGKDLPGARLLVPWGEASRLWLPRRDRLWTTDGKSWTFWGLEDGVWSRVESGPGVLEAHPPLGFGKRPPSPDASSTRETSPADRAAWALAPADLPPWPGRDPAWYWREEGSALTAWDLRWNEKEAPLPKERQRAALLNRFRGDWRTALSLRASVKGWLPQGPEVALREAQSAAWIWVGDRVLLVRLQETERLRALKRLPGLR